MKILLVTSHDSVGGASRAMHRIYSGLRTFCAEQANFTLRVVHKTRDDDHIIGGKPERNRLEFAEYFIRTRFRKYFPRRPFVSDNRLLHSQALYPSGMGREINALNPDVVMLGWLGSAVMSIREIGKLKPPVVWRLSDMWMFSGSEHYTSIGRYSSGYSRKSRPGIEEGPDIDRETFLRKKRHWTSPRHVICPSTWIATQVARSTLTSEWPTHVIPNPIDTDYWSPVPRARARRTLGLPEDSLLVVFGAGSGMKDHHKGGDLFLDALSHLPSKIRGKTVTGVVFGQDGDDISAGDIFVRFLGRLDDDQLRALYSAANVTVVPSRMDNLPSTAVEAQTCGCPVVAFNIGGLPDIVEDGKTGFLATEFDTEELAGHIDRVLQSAPLEKSLREAARHRALHLWRPDIVAQQYLEVLKIAASGSSVSNTRRPLENDR